MSRVIHQEAVSIFVSISIQSCIIGKFMHLVSRVALVFETPCERVKYIDRCKDEAY